MHRCRVRLHRNPPFRKISEMALVDGSRSFKFLLHVILGVIAAATLYWPESSSADGAMPAINVQLRNICLSVSDDRLGSIRVAPLSSLPVAPTNESVKVVTEWRTKTSVAQSMISDGIGNTLRLNERVVPAEQCDSIAFNVFVLQKSGPAYRTDFCISGSDLRTRIRVKMELEGTDGQDPAPLLQRLLAVASCYPTRGLDVLYDGVVVYREIVRTTH